MSTTVTIVDESSPGKATGSITLDHLPTTFTSRELIRTRVREEVARHNGAPRRVFVGLVRPSDAETSRNGYLLPDPRRLDWERQAAAAEQAFGRNGFFVIVDGRQVEDLDEELELGVDTEIRFLRLTPLTGG